MINCVIIEDEPLAQKGLLNLIKPIEGMTVLAVCDNVAEFLEFQKTNTDKAINLLFLDIELPGMNGISFLRDINTDIPVILTTAYHHYAIESYELNVLDYLLKPISKKRFAQAITKVESFIDFLKLKSSDKSDFVYVRTGRVIEKVFFNEILFVEAMRNYVIYYCETRKLICYNSLKNVQQALPASPFIKVQKSFVINKDKIEKIEKGSVLIRGKAIAIARENKNEIIKQLMEI